jgi:hypothetical protein
MELLQSAESFLEQALARSREKLFRWTPEFQSLVLPLRLVQEFPPQSPTQIRQPFR